VGGMRLGHWISAAIMVMAAALGGPGLLYAIAPEILDLWSEGDDSYYIYVNGQLAVNQPLPYCGWPGLQTAEHTTQIPLVVGLNVLAIEVWDDCGTAASAIAWMRLLDPQGMEHDFATDGRWRASRTVQPGWNSDPSYDDSAWSAATDNGEYSSWPIYDPTVAAPLAARWIWDSVRTEIHHPSGDVPGEHVFLRTTLLVGDIPVAAIPAPWTRVKRLYE
jgi:hypothetical protein